MLLVFSIYLAFCLDKLSACDCENSKKVKRFKEDEFKYETRYIFAAYAHGYRTPCVEEIKFLRKGLLKDIKFEPYGLGTQIREGNNLSFSVGRFLNSKYGDLNGDFGFINGPIQVRSTNHRYTKISALVGMLGLSNPLLKEPGIASPLLYSCMEYDKDDLLYYKNCPKYKDLRQKALDSAEHIVKKQIKEVCTEANKLISKFSERPSTTVDDIMTLENLMSALLVCKQRPDWYDDNLEKTVTKCVELVYEVEYNYDELIKLAHGVTLTDIHHIMQTVMTNISQINIVPVPMYIVAGHPRTVASWIAGCNCKMPTNETWHPRYGALVTLLIVYYPSINEYGVKAFYLSDPAVSDNYVELQIKGCEYLQLCKLNNFIKLTSKYLMSRKEYNRECNIAD